MKDFKDQKLVSVEEIVGLAKKYEKTAIATLSGDFDIGFYPYFAKEKILNVVNNVSEFLAFEDDKDDESTVFVDFVREDETEQNFMLLIYFFMITEFTHIGSDLDGKKKPKELFPYFEAMLKTGYLIEIVDEVFNAEEVAKVITEISKTAAISNNLELMTAEFTSQLEEQEDAIKRLQKFQKTMDKKNKKSDVNG